MSQNEDSEPEDVSATASTTIHRLPLRPLAPKANQPLHGLHPSSATSTPRPGFTIDGRCEACFSRTCSLFSHRLHSQRRRTRLLGITPQIPPRTRDNALSSSYALEIGNWFTEGQSISSAGWTYELPISGEMDQAVMRQLFRDWFVVQVPNFFTVPPPPEIVNDLLHSPFLQSALIDSLLCHSILAVSAATGTDVPDPMMNVLALTLLDQAMSLLRRRVAVEHLNLGDKTIVAAVYLWIVNLALTDKESSKGHASSIQALVATRGGIEKLGMSGAVGQLLRWTDLMHSMRIHEPCHYSMPYKIPRQPQVDVSHYGSFWKQGDPRQLPTTDEDIINACRDCCHIIDVLELHEPGRMQAATYWYLYQKTCHVFQQSSLVRAKHYDSGTMEECIILTIDLLKLLVFSGGCVRSKCWDVKSLCSDIVEAVKCTGSSKFRQGYQDLLIWMTFVVRTAEHDSGDEEWSKKVLQSVLESKFGHRENWANSWQNELRILLASFGWSHSVLSSGIDATCAKIFS